MIKTSITKISKFNASQKLKHSNINTPIYVYNGF